MTFGVGICGCIALGIACEAADVYTNAERRAIGPGSASANPNPRTREPIEEPRMLDSTIILTNTGAGGVGASGVVRFQGGNGDGSEPSVLTVNIQGLASGHYELKGLRKSDGGLMVLGVLAIGDPTLQPDRETNSNKKEDHTTYQSESLVSQTRLVLPPNVDPKDIAQLMVSPVGGNAVLMGNRSSSVQAPAPAAPR
jgi:hypothetical protein